MQWVNRHCATIILPQDGNDWVTSSRNQLTSALDTSIIYSNSASHPSGVSKWVLIHVITWITGVETIIGRTGPAYGSLVPGQSPWERAWPAAYGVYALSVCDTRAPLQLVVLYRGYHCLYGSTSCCISHGPCQWERAIFDPPQIGDPWTDFYETWNI